MDLLQRTNVPTTQISIFILFVSTRVLLNELPKLRLHNVNKVIIGNININSFPAKFDQVKNVYLKM